MSTEENKAVVRRWVEARNTHDLEAAIALWTDDWQERIRASFNRFSESFPDVCITVEALIAEDNDVVSRWTFRATHLGTYQGVPATGKTVTWTGIDIYTVVDGKITSYVREADKLSLLHQLGVTVS